MEFTRLAFLRLDSPTLKTSVYIDWAERLLNEGCDAPSIAELAGCSWDANPDPKQAELIFLACVSELNLELPVEWYQALLLDVCSICKKIIDEEIESWDGLGDILTLAEDNNDPYMLTIWIDLVADFSPLNRIEREEVIFNANLKLENTHECIVRTASQFIALCGFDLPEKFPWVWMCQECDSISEETTFTATMAHDCPNCLSKSSMKNMRFYQNREDYVANCSQNSAWLRTRRGVESNDFISN